IDRGSGQHPGHPRVAHRVLVSDVLDRLGKGEEATAALDDVSGRPGRGQQRVVDRLSAVRIGFRDLVRLADSCVGGRVLIHQPPQLAAQLLSFPEDRAGLRFDFRVGFLAGVKPLACPPGSPPLDVRICFAISFATAISCVSRYTLNATRNGRAPIAVAPAVGCTLLGPKSGSSARSRMASNSPLRTSGSSTRSGRVAARAYRKTGIRSSFPTGSPSVCASATHSSIVMPVTGTNGTTSVAPMRGCSPLCLVRSIRSVATRMAA